MIDLPENVIVPPPYVGPADVPVGMFLVEHDCNPKGRAIDPPAAIYVLLGVAGHPCCACGGKTLHITDQHYANFVRTKRWGLEGEPINVCCLNTGRFIE